MSTGTDFWSPTHLALLTQGRWLIAPGDAPQIKGFAFDTRMIKPGEAFIAVRGEQNDGHDHVAAAIERGAAMVIVEKEITHLKSQISNPKCSVLLVPDSVRALQQIASAWRDELRKSNVKVIAITGSSGKTSTRHMIHAALSSTLRGTQSPKSFNNHLGVPLTLLAAKTDQDFVVAEVGTNQPTSACSAARTRLPRRSARCSATSKKAASL
jgi:UDP-N-acetylmuramoyl-tripeptide--D-alanyl-D-alanine ligase